MQDAGIKRSLAELYRRAWADAEQGQPAPPADANYRSARHLMERFEDAPIMIVACLRIDGRDRVCMKDRASIRPSRTCFSRPEVWASQVCLRTAGQSMNPN